MTKLAFGTCLTALLLAAGLLSGRPAATRAAPPQASADTPSTETRTEKRGVAIQLTFGYRPLEHYIGQIDEIAGMGANTLLLSASAKMEHARSQAIWIDTRETPSAADFVEIIRAARARKLHVIVMPIVLLKHPRGSEWRGMIEPPDWKEWWSQYRDIIRYFADLAKEGGADTFLVGSELVSTERNTAEWLKVIELARKHFPGRLGYSANWDHYKPIQFWDKLDVIGMTSYYTLAKRRGPTIEEIAETWEPIRNEILAWREKMNKPLILTEVGWCSQEGAATAPWNYYQNQRATEAGHEEQRRLYEGFLKAWDGAPGVEGFIWWEWTAPGGKDDYGYTPRGKPAELVLRRWLSEGGSAARATHTNGG